ncbi:MAG: response regulator transcription factor [Cyanobium sp.]
MDFTPKLEQIRRNTNQIHNLLRDARLVACLGNRALLSLFVTTQIGQDHVVGAATCATAGLALVERHQPSMVFLSDTLEQGSGIAMVLEIKRRWPSINTLLLISQEHRQAAIQSAIAAGCTGLLLESRLGLGNAMAAMHSISGGGVYIERSLAALFRQGHRGCGPLEALSERELEVLGLVARGESNVQIGQQLFITAETVKTHLRNLFSKLQARDRTHAAVLGLRWGLIDFPEDDDPS